jgi:Sel1 repeat
MVELQRQLILDPDAIPEPPADDAGALRPIVMRFSAVMGLAALIAWGVVSIPGMKKAGDIVPPDMKAPAMTIDPAKFADPAKSADRVQAQSTDTAPTAKQGSVAMTDPPPSASLGPVVTSIGPVPAIVASQPVSMPSQPAAAPSPPPATPAPTNNATAPHIDNAEITAMIKRGKDILMSGDIISARLLLRRAADAGSAEAALALGSTFDPIVIRRLGAVGMTPDIAQARQWYQRAADLGSAAAMGQLAKLAQAQ